MLIFVASPNLLHEKNDAFFTDPFITLELQ
jgi:hypothetical protein